MNHKVGIAPHSFYPGDSVFFGWMKGRKIGTVKLKDGEIRIYVELCFMIGIYLFLDGLGLEVTATILAISQTFLFVDDYRVYRYQKEFEYDFYDSQIDSDYYMELQEKSNKIEKGETHLASIKEGQKKGAAIKSINNKRFKATI